MIGTKNKLERKLELNSDGTLVNDFYILAKFTADYSDEFDVYGFKIFTKSQWDTWVNLLDQVSYPYNWYFGTNESILFDYKSMVLEEIDLSKISRSEYNTLYDLFGESWGRFPKFRYEN